MSEHEVAYAIIFAWLGFSWGQWWAERRRKEVADVGLRLLTEMFTAIRDKRRLVGRAMTITSTHRFEVLGEKLSLIVKAEGSSETLLGEGEANARHG